MAGQIANLGGHPILILSEGSVRSTGRDAQMNNISAAAAIGDTVKTTLGPKGMDKMLVDSMGDVTITNDGATILEEMQIEHPAAKMMVEIAKTQDEEVGDGTTTAVVIASELLKKAGELIEQKIHPTTIAKGYRLAKEKALESLDSVSVKIESADSLIKIAKTSMAGKLSEQPTESLAKVAVDAVNKVMKPGSMIDTKNIKFMKKSGGSITDTELIEGIVISKEIAHSGMPRRVEKARIALVSSEFGIKDLESDAEVKIDTPEKFQAFIDAEDGMLRDMAAKVKEAGANVLFCRRSIDDTALFYLAKAKIMAVGSVENSDMDLLAKATGAKIVGNVNSLSNDDIGFAGIVYEKKLAGEEAVFVEKCKEPKAITILLRGGTEHFVDEAERAMNDAVKSVASAIELGKAVPGGGAAEMAVAKAVRKFAESMGGREQLAATAFAEAVESIPRNLAENSGLDPIDSLVRLRSENGKGLDINSGKSQDMIMAGVIEPLKVKVQAIKSASEAAEMILRIDDVISASARSSKGSDYGRED